MTRVPLLLVALLLAAGGQGADAPYLVKDFPGFTAQSSIAQTDPFWTTIGNTTWFAGAVSGWSFEVWKTDGTAQGAVHVADIIATEGRERAHALVYLGALNGKLIFGGHDVGGEGIFSLDMNGRTPLLLARTDLSHLTAGGLLDGVLYFSARESVESADLEIWRSDGTPGGTLRIDQLPGARGTFWGSRERRVFVVSGALYFFGKTALGSGFHRSDGSVAGTALLLPMLEPALNNEVEHVVVLNDRLVFSLREKGERPAELFATDGSAAGVTSIARDFPQFQPLGILGGKLFFTVSSAATTWTTDGTAAGTKRQPILADSGLGTLTAGAVIGNTMYFYGKRGSVKSLFVTQGSAETTREVMVVEHHGVSFAAEGFVIGERFCFRHDDGVHGSEPWVTDGTAAGSHLLQDVHPGPGGGFTDVRAHARPDGALFAAARPDIGVEPWFTDGTDGGTRLIANVAPELPIHSSSPRNLENGGNRLFFSATLNAGPAIGTSDGSAAGTSAIQVALPDEPFDAVASAGRYFFRSGSPAAGLFASDGTTAGTTKIHPQSMSAPAPVPGGVVFLGSDEGVMVPWFSDGSVAGTRLIRSVATASESLRLFAAGGRAWIASGSRLWKTDGTENGTAEVAAVEGRAGQTVAIAGAGSAVYLVESQPAGTRLWRYDGATTHLVASLSGDPSSLIGTNRQLFFFIANRLYRTDGTAAGTIPLPVTAATPANYHCPQFAVAGDTLVFMALDPRGYPTLWRSDGNVEGTVKLITMTTRSMGSCEPLAALDGAVYFAGWDSAHGWEPWVTDGTVAGTTMLRDLYPGLRSSDPGDLATSGERVFFSAESPFTGRELWAIGANLSTRGRAARH